MARRKNHDELPEPFSGLDKWVPDWALPDSTARFKKRRCTSLAEIRAFYDALLPQADAILKYLSTRQLGTLTPPEGKLLKLMLSLAEMGPAIEWYGTENHPEAFDGRRFPLVVTLADMSPQPGAHT